MRIPPEMIREDGQMQQPVPVQNLLHNEIEAVADDGQRHPAFLAALIQIEDAFINWQISGEGCQRFPISLD